MNVSSTPLQSPHNALASPRACTKIISIAVIDRPTRWEQGPSEGARMALLVAVLVGVVVCVSAVNVRNGMARQGVVGSGFGSKRSRFVLVRISFA